MADVSCTRSRPTRLPGGGRLGESHVVVPEVWHRGAQWSSRSTVAVATVFGMSSSNPDGCESEPTATEWRS